MKLCTHARAYDMTRRRRISVRVFGLYEFLFSIMNELHTYTYSKTRFPPYGTRDFEIP